MSDHDMLREAIRRLREEGMASTEALRLVCDAAESTLPKTKTVQRWKVEWTYRGASGAYQFLDDFAGAALTVQRMCENPYYSGFIVTGPHEQEVPA